MARSQALLLWVYLLHASPCEAQPDEHVLTLQEATQQFLNTGPRVREARARAQQAQAGVVDAGLLPNPTVDIQHGQTADQVEQTAVLELVLPLSGRRGALVRGATAGVRAAEVELHQQLSQLAVDLQRAFLTVVRLRQQRDLIELSLGELARWEQVAQRRAQAGQNSGLDSLRLLAEGDLLRSKARGLEVEETRARAALAGLLGLGTPIRPVGRIETPLPLLTTEALLDRALQQGAPAVIRARLEQLQYREDAARRLMIPEPAVRGGLWRIQESSTSALGGVVGLSIPFPIGDRGQGERAAAMAERRVLEAERLAVEHELTVQLKGRVEAAKQAKTRAEVFEREGIKRSELGLRQAGLAYEAGELSLSTLMEVLRLDLTAREQLLEAHFDARMQELAVQEAAGIIPEYHTTTGG